MADEAKHLVIFQPSGSRGEVSDGITILDAARTLGVEIETPCGGRLMCSKCRVRIEEGRFERFGVESSIKHLNPILKKEQEFFHAKGITEVNSRQSCVAKIHGPVVVYVPEESRAVKQLVRKSAREVNIDIKPAVRRYFVEMKEATLHDPQADWERLQACLHSQHNVSNPSIDPLVLRELQSVVRAGDWTLTCFVFDGHPGQQDPEVIRVSPGFIDYTLGLAVDVGTTTVAGFLCDLDSGRVLASESFMNPQTPFGDDVMARITYSMTRDDGLDTMHAAIINGLNTMIDQICETSGYQPDEILEAVLVGNTCMDHIFLKISPDQVGVSPFTPAIHSSVDIKARDFGLAICKSANIHILPNEAGFLGSDNVACIIAEEPHHQDDVILIIDIGTNGEMVLGNRHKLISASVPTGPAFEGAQIDSGMRAAKGAIENVEINPITWDVRFRVIGSEHWSDEIPDDLIQSRGLCGSAIIDLGWELYRSGVVDASGRFSTEKHSARLREGKNGMEFVIAWASQTVIERDIIFTLMDVRALQLAKAAMYSAAKIMMRHMGVDRLDKVVLAGAFGSYINKTKAMAMGLFPDCELKNVYAVGNAAGDGARMALLNIDKRSEANNVAQKVEYVELTVEPDYQDQFSEAMHFPHITDSFPHAEKLISKATQDRALRTLRNLPAFAGLTDTALRPLAKSAVETRVRKNKLIFDSDSNANELYVLKEGAARLVFQSQSDEQNCKPGSILNASAATEQQHQGMSAKATTLNTRVLAIPMHIVRKLLKEAPQIEFRFRESST